MFSVHFRAAVISDIHSLAEIRAVNSYDYAYWYERIEQYFKRTKSPPFAHDSRAIFVATYEEKVVSFVAGHLSNRFNCEGELQWVDTLEPYRNMGIGSRLIKLLAGWFAYHNANKICVDPGNAEARKFYEKNQAIKLNDHWMYWNKIVDLVTQPDHLGTLALGD